MRESEREFVCVCVCACVCVSLQRDHEILITPVGWRGRVSDKTIDGSLAISLLFLCLSSQQLATQSGTPFTYSDLVQKKTQTQESDQMARPVFHNQDEEIYNLLTFRVFLITSVFCQAQASCRDYHENLYRKCTTSKYHS